MQTLIRHIPYNSRSAYFNIYFLGDIHLGAAHCDEVLLKQTVEHIRKDGRALVFLMGDIVDAILPKDKRFEAGLVAEWVDRSNVLGSQVKEACKILKPIGGKVIGILDGNHEEKVKQDQSFRIKRELIDRMGADGFIWKDLSYSSLVRLIFAWRAGKSSHINSLTLYLHHGWGGGRGDATNQYKEMMASYEADWFVFGHTHKRYVMDELFYKLNRAGDLVETRRVSGRSGTFLRTVDKGDEASYGEQKGYRPTPRGCLCIKYYPHPDSNGAPKLWSWVNDVG
jgi:predicted phosphodiesterase